MDETQTCWLGFFASFDEVRGVLESTLTCNLKYGGRYALDKKTNVKFVIVTYRSISLLDNVHVNV